MNNLIENLIIYMFGVGTAGSIAIWIFNNRNAIIALAAWFFRTFGWISTRFEYGNVAFNIEATINRVGEEFDLDAPDVLPYPMKIVWAKTSEDIEASLRNGEMVVTMQYSKNRDKNLVVSTLAYLRKGLLPRARPYVDKSLMTATDMAVAKDVFVASKLETAIPYFFENILGPATQEDPSLVKHITRIDRIKSAGFFSRVFLREVKFLGDKIYPATPNTNIWEETTEFSEFLESIAEKEKGVDVPGGLFFAGNRIRTSMMLVARPVTRDIGIKPYLRRIQIDLDRGVEHMYVFARSKDNISLAESVMEEAETREMLKIISTHHFHQTVNGNQRQAICYVCAMNLLMRPTERTAPSMILLELLKEHVSELAQGKLEVVAAARQPGTKSKIAIRSLDRDLDPVVCFTRDKTKETIETILGEEVEFVQWVNDPKELILSSLYPVDRESVVEIKIDSENKSAEVRLRGWKAKRKALGKGDINKGLAKELTGWNLSIIDVNEKQLDLPLEDTKKVE